MPAYLFVHFREKSTPDGEQVYFSVSRDGFHWEKINGGYPILWAFYGDKGVRDMTIIREKKTGRFHLFATDLSLAYGMRGPYHHSWEAIGRQGSKALAYWASDDLTHWTEQRLIPIGDEHFGCVWAPDIIYDRQQDDYVLHWSSSIDADDYASKAIYYARTKDFEHFTAPRELYRKADTSVIDSAIYEEDGAYYMFVKSDEHPAHVILLRAPSITGPYERVPAFDECMLSLAQGQYEAPTAVRLEDGRWCLFLDYYGVRGAGQGYVPFVADSLASGEFRRADEAFDFPYGFKHGTILTITMEEYERLKGHVWPID